jgi:hypothetical protein
MKKYSSALRFPYPPSDADMFEYNKHNAKGTVYDCENCLKNVVAYKLFVKLFMGYYDDFTYEYGACDGKAFVKCVLKADNPSMNTLKGAFQKLIKCGYHLRIQF